MWQDKPIATMVVVINKNNAKNETLMLIHFMYILITHIYLSMKQDKKEKILFS